MSNELLHIYAQDCEHEQAEIAGGRQTLLKLRDAISTALDRSRAECSRDAITSIDACTADGEGYVLVVNVLADPSELADERSWPLPYVRHVGYDIALSIAENERDEARRQWMLVPITPVAPNCSVELAKQRAAAVWGAKVAERLFPTVMP